MTFPLPSADTHPEFYASTASKRLVAWVIDVIITFVITLILTPFTFFIAVLFWPFFFALVGFFYRTTTLATSSSTWGMRLMAIELRRNTGERLDLPTAALHTFGLIISFAMPLLQIASMILMVASDRGQGLTDRVLGTSMINRLKS